MQSFSLRTPGQTCFVNITRQVSDIVAAEAVKEGICQIYCPHTTAGITINEAADPDVARDMVMELNKIVPFHDNYAHLEGNSAAHIKATLVGSSAMVPISKGRLVLGTWQGIYFCEFDGSRSRSVHVQVVGSI